MFNYCGEKYLIKRFVNKGFTLVELLVVISIIVVLSSVVFASVSSAREKAKDANVKSAVVQLSKLMVLEYNESESYARLQPNNQWFNSEANCNNAAIFLVSGNYATQARQLCGVIVKNAKSNNNAGSGTSLWMGNNVSVSSSYSIMAGLNNGKYFCYGSSGSSEATWNGVSWSSSGCYANP